MLGHKTSLGKCKKTEIISSTFYNHNAMRLEMNYREKNVKNTNAWRLSNTLVNNQEITEEIKEEIKKYLETNDNENTTIQNLWDAAKEKNQNWYTREVQQGRYPSCSLQRVQLEFEG